MKRCCFTLINLGVDVEVTSESFFEFIDELMNRCYKISYFDNLDNSVRLCDILQFGCIYVYASREDSVLIPLGIIKLVDLF